MRPAQCGRAAARAAASLLILLATKSASTTLPGGGGAAAAAASAASAAGPVPLPLGVYPFVDASLLDPSATSPGLSLQHGPVLKDLDNPLVVPGEFPWEAGVHFYTSAVEVPPGTYPWLPASQRSWLLYYGCLTADQVIFFSNVSICVANSTDGRTWEKPLLPYVPFTQNGTQPPVNSNIVFVTDVNEFIGSVFVDPNPSTPPEARFKMVYEADPTRFATIATSPDGFRWSGRTRMDPLPEGFADTQLGMAVVAGGTYLVYGRQDGPSLPNSTVGCEGGYPSERRVFYSSSATSATGGFDRPIEAPALTLGAPDPYNCFDSYNNGASFAVAAAGGVSFLFPSAFKHWSINASGAPSARAAGNDGVMDIRLLVSRDPLAQNFTYVSRDAFLPRGIGAVDPSCGLVNATGSERDAGFVFATVGGLLDFDPSSPWISFLFWGSQTTHAGGGAFLGRYWPGAFSGVFRAKVRREGLVSLSTPFGDPEGGASFRTLPVSLPAPPPTEQQHKQNQQLVLRVNAMVSTAGNITVAVLDPSTGEALPGFGAADSLPVHGNGLRQLVSWTGGPDLSGLVGRAGGVVFGVTMAHTHLYALSLAYE